MRLFIAVLLPPTVEKTLLNAMDQLRDQVVTANFTRRENLHLTLAFIGETDRLDVVRSALERLEGRAMEITLGGWGNFGNLYWVGLKNAAPLAALAGRLRRELERAGFCLDPRPFAPHITIARQVQAENPPQLVVPEEKLLINKVSLMSSERHQGRLVYTEIGWKKLAEDK